MKRFLALNILVCLLLSGCSTFSERLKEPVTFYYLRSEYQYFAQDGVFVSEEREASGHRNDLSYLMALYLIGPSSEDLRSPVPPGTRISSVEQTSEGVMLQLSDTEKTMTDLEFSLACGCLSLTCFDLTDANSVTIQSGERSVTMTRDTLALYDGSQNNAEEAQ